MLPGRLAPRSLAGEDPGSAPSAVAHAVRNVLPGAGHRKAPGAVELERVGRGADRLAAVRLQVLLRVRELAAGLEAGAAYERTLAHQSNNVPGTLIQGEGDSLSC